MFLWKKYGLQHALPRQALVTPPRVLIGPRCILVIPFISHVLIDPH